MKTIIGIDYSIKSPAICVKKGNHLKWHYLTNNPKQVLQNPIMIGEQHRDYALNAERWDDIAYWAMSIIEQYSIYHTRLYLEGYAMGAKGMVFNLAENTGLLKHFLYKRGYRVEILSPHELKKYAVGTSYKIGKPQMLEAFKAKGVYDLEQYFTTKENPISDMVDAYFLAEYGDSIENAVVA